MPQKRWELWQMTDRCHSPAACRRSLRSFFLDFFEYVKTRKLVSTTSNLQKPKIHKSYSKRRTNFDKHRPVIFPQLIFPIFLAIKKTNLVIRWSHSALRESPLFIHRGRSLRRTRIWFVVFIIRGVCRLTPSTIPSVVLLGLEGCPRKSPSWGRSVRRLVCKTSITI